MGKKKSFLFYYDWCDVFEPLSNELKGELIDAIIKYANTGAEPEFENLALKISFNVIRNTIRRDTEKYELTCQRNAENIKKRWNSISVEN